MSGSEEGHKPGGPGEPTLATPEMMRESLEELAANVDDLVDRLTMGMTDTPVDQASASQSPVAPPSIQTPPVDAVSAPASTESDEDVEALADGMVDALTSTEEDAPSPPLPSGEDTDQTDTEPRGEIEIDVDALAKSMVDGIIEAESSEPSADASPASESDAEAPPVLEIDTTPLEQPAAEPVDATQAADVVDVCRAEPEVEDDSASVTEPGQAVEIDETPRKEVTTAAAVTAPQAPAMRHGSSSPS